MTLFQRTAHSFCAVFFLSFIFILSSNCASISPAKKTVIHESVRERVLLDSGWRFKKYADDESVDALIYDVLPEIHDSFEGKQADSQPTEAVKVESGQRVMKPWILPTANDFITDPDKHHQRPEGQPGANFPFVQANYDDSQWQDVTLPHDWAIQGPFYEGGNVLVGGGMGRLPSVGTAWYRKKLDIGEQDKGKNIFLDVDGAMSYAMVWLNGHLVGGWPYGYASWRVDLTPYVNFGGENQLAVRMNNPRDSSRWYQGGGFYRNVWLTKTNKVHMALWGTHVYATEISEAQSTVHVDVTVENDGDQQQSITSITDIYLLDADDNILGDKVVSVKASSKVNSGAKLVLSANTKIDNPALWGPYPTQTPHRYIAHTRLKNGNKVLDDQITRFGIRTLEFDPNKGLFVNGEHIRIQGVNQHHDLGALGAAFNVRAAERQLEKLRDMGVNAIRMAHNPPARELLDLTDKMGFLVVNEIFDVWERKKAPLDYHLIFPEWYEADLRSFIRRDRNNPSVIMWSVGNEVGEQYTGEAGAEVGRRLHNIVKEEDTTRPTAASLNYAKPDMALPGVFDTISLNYQGEGIRYAEGYKHLTKGIRTPPMFNRFREAFPDKLILSSENAAAVSSRGEYIFPVTPLISAPAEGGSGGDDKTQHVSSYELYTTQFGSSADKVLASLAKHPFVAGGFIWSGWDYLGEPTPYYSSRSSYFGVIDLAGFPKDRFYLYQSAWRPELPMVHVLPHWNWPGREGKVTPVHVFTSGDEAELFLNGRSLGKKQKGPFEHRLRWDDVKYEPGKLEVVAYKEGKEWANTQVETTGQASQIFLEADRDRIQADGKDLAFISVRLKDKEGRFVANAKNHLTFNVSGAGELVATDNGDPTDMTVFSSNERKAFNGLALAIVRTLPDKKGKIVVEVSGDGLKGDSLTIEGVE